MNHRTIHQLHIYCTDAETIQQNLQAIGFLLPLLAFGSARFRMLNRVPSGTFCRGLVGSIESTTPPSFLDAAFPEHSTSAARHDLSDFLSWDFPKNRPSIVSDPRVHAKFPSEARQPGALRVPLLWFLTTPAVFSSWKAARILQRTYRSWGSLHFRLSRNNHPCKAFLPFKAFRIPFVARAASLPLWAAVTLSPFRLSPVVPQVHQQPSPLVLAIPK